jgi:hypothetical protein
MGSQQQQTADEASNRYGEEGDPFQQLRQR